MTSEDRPEGTVTSPDSNRLTRDELPALTFRRTPGDRHKVRRSLPFVRSYDVGQNGGILF